MMTEKLVTFLTFVTLLTLSVMVTADDGTEPKSRHDYIGAEQCKRCHQEIYNTWLESPHALAYDGVFGKFPGRLQKRVKSEPHCYVEFNFAEWKHKMHPVGTTAESSD